MTVLVIRASKRFAVCKTVKLRATKAGQFTGLMIELSLEGCRISQLGDITLEIGEEVSLDLGQGQRLAALVRWSHNGQAGLRLLCPLHRPELTMLITMCRTGWDTRGQRRAIAASR